MSLDGFLTFFGILFAGYAVIDPVTRLKLRLDTPSQVVLLFVCITAILFFEFINPLVSVLPLSLATWIVDLEFGQPTDKLSNTQIAFIITLIWSVSAFLLFRFSRPKPRKLGRLLPLIERLYDERRYLELLTLVEPYIPAVKKSYSRDHLTERAHDWLSRAAKKPSFWDDILNKQPRWRSPPALRPFVFVASRMIPSFKGRSVAAKEIIEVICKSPDLRGVLQTQKPELAADFFMSIQSIYHEEFDKYVFESMLKVGSHLRGDIRRSTSISGVTYVIDKESAVLYSIFNDANFPKNSGLWKPVGESALKVIREDQGYVDIINRAPPFEDEDLFDDIFFSAIHLFDVMVTQAAVNGVEDHMWLMYLRHFVDKIENVHCMPKIVDGEFPTLGTRLIWECQHRLQNWVELSWRLPEENVHSIPTSLDEAKDGGIIPYWAALSLCDVVRRIITSKNLPDEFKRERFGSFVRTASQISRSGRGSYLRKFLARGVVYGPYDFDREDISEDIYQVLPYVDALDQSNFKELKEVLYQ